MQSGDNFTKRARPTLVYAGLAMIAWKYCLAPVAVALAGVDLPDVDFPAEFWLAWGGAVSIWSIGRSQERAGVQNKLVSHITGNKPAKSLLEPR